MSQRKAWGIARSIVEKSSLDRFGGTSAQYRTEKWDAYRFHCHCLQLTSGLRAVSSVAYKNQRRKAAALRAVPARASMPCHIFRRVAADHWEAVFK